MKTTPKLFKAVLMLAFYSVTFFGALSGICALAVLLNMAGLFEDLFSIFGYYDFSEKAFTFLGYTVLCLLCIWTSNKVETRINAR